MENIVISKSFGEIFAKKGHNDRIVYEHQKKDMECLDIINRISSYSTLIVIPTGSGKTYTASSWLIKNAVDNNKKILWIAHRHMFFDQAAESFQRYAFSDIMPHVSSFKKRCQVKGKYTTYGCL